MDSTDISPIVFLNSLPNGIGHPFQLLLLVLILLFLNCFDLVVRHLSIPRYLFCQAIVVLSLFHPFFASLLDMFQEMVPVCHDGFRFRLFRHQLTILLLEITESFLIFCLKLAMLVVVLGIEDLPLLFDLRFLWF